MDVILLIGAPFQQIDSAPGPQCTYNSLATYSGNKLGRLWGGKNQFMNHLLQVMPLDSLSAGKQERPLLLAQSSGSPWDLLSSSTFPPDFPYQDQLSKDVLHNVSFKLPWAPGAVRASSQTSNVILYGECCLKLGLWTHGVCRYCERGLERVPGLWLPRILKLPVFRYS